METLPKGSIATFQRALLDLMVQKFSGFIEEETLKKIILVLSIKFFGIHIMPTLKAAVQEINETFKQRKNPESEYHLEITKGTCELTGTTKYFFVEIDTKGKIKQPFLEGDRRERLFRNVMDAMFNKKHNDYCIPRTECLKMGLTLNLKDFTEQSINTYLDDMIRHGYFAKCRAMQPNDEEALTLGIRTLIECAETLQNRHGSRIKNCTECNNIVLHGFQCTQHDYYIHTACSKMKIPACPNCSPPLVHSTQPDEGSLPNFDTLLK